MQDILQKKRRFYIIMGPILIPGTECDRPAKMEEEL